MFCDTIELEITVMDLIIILIILLAVVSIWLVLLSFMFFKERSFLEKVFPLDSRKMTDEAVVLRSQFEKIILALEQSKEREKVTAKHLQEMRKEGLGFIQSVDTMRYNPYGDVGGDESFSLLLMDGKKNGVILTSLHSRANTRIYVKPVKEGKAQLELSTEEKQLLGRMK
jgi:hypothetical protein